MNGTLTMLDPCYICVAGMDKKVKILNYSNLSLVTNLDIDDSVLRTAFTINKNIYVLCSNNNMYEFRMKDFYRTNKLTLKNIPYSSVVLEDD